MKISGLYVITDSALHGGRLEGPVEHALKGGAQTVQYRRKDKAAEDYRYDAMVLRQLTLQYKATLIINDDAELARDIGADGVHIGIEDGSIAGARSMIGEDKFIGVSCYNQLDRARRAEAEGADYVAFGSFFASANKPDAVHAPLETLIQARDVLTLPIVAIGGITSGNGRTLIESGADSLAVINAVFGQDNVEAAARRLADLFD